MSILERIEGPKDIKGLGRHEMELLASELRQFIIEGISPTGGHLASSLGVVELTIAIHAVFNSPEDRIIFDVGHQSYVHKILTGRRDRFHTIRKRGGLSGFPKRSESPHDAFGTGHASTSISAAMGMAAGRDIKNHKNKVVAVIGDGSMNSGMAFEGLNHAGHEGRDLVVILNDNEMSISPNVGALSSYLSRVLTGDFYSRLRKDVQELLKAVPLGTSMSKLAKKMEEHAKGFITEGMLFEELGFNYVGPIDGHNLDHLIEALKNIQKFEKPVLVHVYTKKGKGFDPAETDPSRYHGVGPFNPEDGTSIKTEGVRPPPSYTSVFSENLIKEADHDPRIVAITAAMPEGTGLDKFKERFPERFFDVGITEEHAVTFAAGLACEGLKPVVAIYSTFLQRGYDQIIHDVALQKLPVVFALDRAGLVGADGPTHHGAFDLSYLRHIPGLTVMAPSDEAELGKALRAALACDGPAALRYPRGQGVGTGPGSEADPWEHGKGRVVYGDGKETGIVVLAAGTVTYDCLSAAKNAAEKGVSVTVFDARFVKPLDGKTIAELAGKASGIITVEENALPGGFGSAVLEFLSESGITGKKVVRLGLPDAFVEHGTQAELKASLGIDADGILRAILAMAGVRD